MKRTTKIAAEEGEKTAIMPIELDNKNELEIRKGKERLTEIQSMMVKSIIRKNFEEGNKFNRLSIKEECLKHIEELKEATFNRFWRDEETSYYQSLKRIPAEILVSKLTEQNDYLKDKVINESSEDITKQVAAITKLDDIIIKINKLTDAPAVIAIRFETNVDPMRLINPNITMQDSLTYKPAQIPQNMNKEEPLPVAIIEQEGIEEKIQEMKEIIQEARDNRKRMWGEDVHDTFIDSNTMTFGIKILLDGKAYIKSVPFSEIAQKGRNPVVNQLVMFKTYREEI